MIIMSFSSKNVYSYVTIIRIHSVASCFIYTFVPLVDNQRIDTIDKKDRLLLPLSQSIGTNTQHLLYLLQC